MTHDARRTTLRLPFAQVPQSAHLPAFERHFVEPRRAMVGAGRDRTS
jgi:hypothetical protein